MGRTQSELVWPEVLLTWPRPTLAGAIVLEDVVSTVVKLRLFFFVICEISL